MDIAEGCSVLFDSLGFIKFDLLRDPVSKDWECYRDRLMSVFTCISFVVCPGCCICCSCRLGKSVAKKM